MHRPALYTGRAHGDLDLSQAYAPMAGAWDSLAIRYGYTWFADERTSAVHRVAMEKFDERAIRPGEPMYPLGLRFVHVSLYHRYSLEGLLRDAGGMDFRYALRGDGQTPTTVAPAADQHHAPNPPLPTLAEVLQAILDGSWNTPTPANPKE